MKIAIMQPYLFPYIGYWQLINAVDKFVILDDVNYINKGWINRNRILINNQEYLFSVPLKKISQNKLILECELSEDPWRAKFLKKIEMSYKKALKFNEVFPLIEDIINCEETNLSRFIFNQIYKICKYLQIETIIIQSSIIYKTNYLKGQDKIISICINNNASQYINPSGGIELYENSRFASKNIQLSFLKTNEIIYSQNSNFFIPLLSIIDVMMHNSLDRLQKMLDEFELL